jgi:phage N-6-adenine-methyltransferase
MSSDWQTPDWFLERVRRLGVIGLDPASCKGNPTKAAVWLTPERDGLTRPWNYSGLVYVNPPYSRGSMMKWAQKATSEALKGAEIVFLARGDTSTDWAHLLIDQCKAMAFPKRIKFKDAKGSPNFSNIIYYFGKDVMVFWSAFEELGPVILKPDGTHV